MAKTQGVALVTGAGRGIGRAIAQELSAHGFALALLARSKDQLHACATEIHQQGGRAEVVICDVTQEQQVANAVRQCQATLGPITRLINNAGCVQRVALADMSMHDFDAVLRCNLHASLICIQACLEDLRRHQGRIINIASISARLGSPMLGAYSAAKAGLVAMTQSLAKELHDEGVSAFSVLPGSVDTQMLQQGLPGATPDMAPQAVAELVRYLCVEAPAAMSGSAVEIFGR